MSVPGTFSVTELANARAAVIASIGKARLTKDGKMIGSPFITYTELADKMGWTIDDEWDGDRMGSLAGQISEQEINMGGPFIGAVIVKKGEMRPGIGFYRYGAHLKRMQKDVDKVDPNGIEENIFWTKEVIASVEKYGR